MTIRSAPILVCYLFIKLFIYLKCEIYLKSLSFDQCNTHV